MLSGEPKVGKTWLLLELMVCVASGLPFLGKQKIHAQGAVIIFSPEGSTHALVDRLLQICNRKKLDLKNLQIRIIEKQRLHLNNPNDQKTICEGIEKARPVLVAFDPFKACFEGDENSQSEVSKVTNFLTTISNRYNCSVIMTHHQVKSRNSSQSDGSKIRGSGVLFSFGDSYLFLKRDKQDRLSLTNIQRHASPLPPIALKLAKTGGHKIDVINRTEKEEQLVDKIHKLLVSEYPASLKLDEIRKSIGGKYSKYTGALKYLRDARLIIKLKKGGFKAKK